MTILGRNVTYRKGTRGDLYKVVPGLNWDDFCKPEIDFFLAPGIGRAKCSALVITYFLSLKLVSRLSFMKQSA